MTPALLDKVDNPASHFRVIRKRLNPFLLIAVAYEKLIVTITVTVWPATNEIPGENLVEVKPESC